MFATMRCLCLLLATVLLADHAHAAGPPMLQELIQGVGRGLRKHGAAKVMSSNDYDKPREKHTVSFHTDQIYNCQRMGCNAYFQDCAGEFCSTCQSDAYAETQLSCKEEHDYDYYGNGQNSFIRGQSRTANLAGHCSWEIHRIYGFGVIYEADGRTQKYGTVRGMCTISDDAEECNSHKEGGPLCGGMTITIDAYWYRTPDGWWKANEDVRLGDDNRYAYQCGTNANPVTCYQPSCCLLDDINIVDAGQCPGSNRNAGERSSNGAANVTTPGVPGTGQDASGVKLQKTSQDASVSSYDASTASYDYHEYSGSYVTGYADVIWGTFYATNMAGDKKWEDEGLVQWVVDTYPGGSGSGTPPNNRYELEPNSLQLMFSKDINSYSYPAATKDTQE